MYPKSTFWVHNMLKNQGYGANTPSTLQQNALPININDLLNKQKVEGIGYK